jgi:DNA-binding MarR family transcriptional regulator
MDTKTALGYVREFLRLYHLNESAHEDWSRRLEAQHKLTAKQYALLRALERQSDMTTTSLTELLGKAQPAITQMLNRLVQNGYVVREQSTEDKRRRDLKLTPKALKLLESVEPLGPTRVALALEYANEREAIEIVNAMKLVNQWMNERKLKRK